MNSHTLNCHERHAQDIQATVGNRSGIRAPEHFLVVELLGSWIPSRRMRSGISFLLSPLNPSNPYRQLCRSLLPISAADLDAINSLVFNILENAPHKPNIPDFHPKITPKKKALARYTPRQQKGARAPFFFFFRK